MGKRNGIIGLILLVFGFALFLLSVETKSDIFWHNKSYVVIEHNQSQHEYKGRAIPEYYLTVKYEDNSTSCFEVSGSSYFLHKDGSSGNSRIENYKFVPGLSIIIMIIGIVMGCVYLVDLMSAPEDWH